MVCLFSGFLREAAAICALLGCHAGYSVSSLSKFRNKLSVPFSRVEKSNIWISSPLKKVVGESKVMDLLDLEDGPDRLSRNASKELPLYAA